jgi:hypothetical protein
MSAGYREIGNDVIVHIKLSPPASPRGHGRPPLDLCCVIDVSGSMNAEATLKDAEGHEEGDGLSILDVVRHGVKTIMQLLEPGDRLAVIKYAPPNPCLVSDPLRVLLAGVRGIDLPKCVPGPHPHHAVHNCVQPIDDPSPQCTSLCRYSSTASIVHRLTFMNDAGKALSKSKLDGLTPMGTTNLWDGLKTGMDVLQRDTEPGRTQYLMLLTDGVPNVEPPRGHIPMLRRYGAHPTAAPCLSSASARIAAHPIALGLQALQKVPRIAKYCARDVWVWIQAQLDTSATDCRRGRWHVRCTPTAQCAVSFPFSEIPVLPCLICLLTRWRSLSRPIGTPSFPT